MIRFAEKTDLPFIKPLWNTAFGSEPEFNQYFFEHFFNLENTLLYIEKEPVAMLQMMPYTLKGVGKVTYIYGAVTHPLYRKKGIMGKLLEKSFEIDKNNGIKGSVLIPANGQLFEYYKKFGYDTLAFTDNFTIEKTEITENNIYSVEKAKPEDLKYISEIYNFCSEHLIERSQEYFKSQYNMFNALGGEVWILKDKNTVSAYCFISELHPLKIQELIAKDPKYTEYFVKYILKIHCENSAEVSSQRGLNPMGMGYFYNGNKPLFYMNLMLN